MFGKDHTPETMAKATELKLANMPILLYKYRAINDHSLEALQNDFLFSTEPQQFNDPFEGPIEISISEANGNAFQKAYNGLREENDFLPIRQVESLHDFIDSIAIGCGGSYANFVEALEGFDYLKELLEAKAEVHLRDIQNKSRNLYNICCFSAVNDNSLMWSHYADKHTGFCIGYGIKELNNDFTELTLPVIYLEKGCFSINNLDDLTGSLCMHALTIKSPEWSYEHEWRTFFLANPPIHKEQMPVPKAVFLGAKINENNKIKLTNICKNKNIPIYKMELQLNHHRLIAKPVQ